MPLHLTPTSQVKHFKDRGKRVVKLMQLRLENDFDKQMCFKGCKSHIFTLQYLYILLSLSIAFHTFDLYTSHNTITEAPVQLQIHFAAGQQVHKPSHSPKELFSATRRTRSAVTGGLAPTESWSQHHGFRLGLHVGTEATATVEIHRRAVASSPSFLK